MPTSTQLVSSLKDVTVPTQAASTSTTPGGALDKNAFLKMLVTQLKNQDPQKPMDDTAFISQMAQFSSLEQMQNLNTTLTSAQAFQSLSEASGMIGKYVSLVSADGKKTAVSGLVQEVRQVSGKANVVINNQEYDSSTITNVSNQPLTTAAHRAPV
jgi:flagellar basal-body rod modification protein FlgD